MGLFDGRAGKNTPRERMPEEVFIELSLRRHEMPTPVNFQLEISSHARENIYDVQIKMAQSPFAIPPGSDDTFHYPVLSPREHKQYKVFFPFKAPGKHTLTLVVSYRDKDGQVLNTYSKSIAVIVHGGPPSDVTPKTRAAIDKFKAGLAGDAKTSPKAPGQIVPRFSDLYAEYEYYCYITHNSSPVAAADARKILDELVRIGGLDPKRIADVEKLVGDTVSARKNRPGAVTTRK